MLWCFRSYEVSQRFCIFCVQTWFTNIVGSVAAALYVALQSVVVAVAVVARLKCKIHCKVPYGSLQQKYDFDPIDNEVEESVSREVVQLHFIFNNLGAEYVSSELAAAPSTAGSSGAVSGGIEVSLCGLSSCLSHIIIFAAGLALHDSQRWKLDRR